MSKIRKESDLIWETPAFTVERHPQPFVSREEGGICGFFQNIAVK